MKKYFFKARGLVFSGTAKDTYILFVGNAMTAFWGFLFTLLVARTLSVSDFGIFSATLNLVIILVSLTDIGIASGVVNFISESAAKGDKRKVNRYIKASVIIRLFITLTVSAIVLAFAPFIAKNLLATSDVKIAIWAAIIPIFLFPDMLFPFILQAKRKFLQSVILDNSFYIGRLLLVFIYYLVGTLTMPKAFWAFGIGFIFNVVLTFVFIGSGFLGSKPRKTEYKKLFKFSGWIGVNRIVTSVSGRLDIQMLAAMGGAMMTGIYAIPSKLASFIVVLAGSYSSVLATRMAGFADKNKERTYLIKSSLALLPIVAGLILWIIIAEPFVLILFGDKYLQSVPVFQALIATQIPFILTAPAVTAIIYAIKKTVYIGAFSFFQIVCVFSLNLVFIPRYGIYGPTITFGIVNSILAIYTWSIAIKHYWFKK